MTKTRSLTIVNTLLTESDLKEENVLALLGNRHMALERSLTPDPVEISEGPCDFVRFLNRGLCFSPAVTRSE